MFSSVHNYYEQMVYSQVFAYLSERGEGKNQELMEDVACIALNLLPPRYVRHTIDLTLHINDDDRQKMLIQVQQAVIKAAELVKRRQHPR